MDVKILVAAPSWLAGALAKLDALCIAKLEEKSTELAPGCSNDMAALPPGPCVITEADLRPVGNYYPPDYKQHVANCLAPRAQFPGYANARHGRRRKW
jgi:hypothetical protein